MEVANMIELVHLEKRYKNAVPLAEVNAVINDGDEEKLRAAARELIGTIK